MIFFTNSSKITIFSLLVANFLTKSGVFCANSSEKQEENIVNSSGNNFDPLKNIANEESELTKEGEQTKEKSKDECFSEIRRIIDKSIKNNSDQIAAIREIWKDDEKTKECVTYFENELEEMEDNDSSLILLAKILVLTVSMKSEDSVSKKDESTEAPASEADELDLYRKNAIKLNINMEVDSSRCLKKSMELLLIDFLRENLRDMKVVCGENVSKLLKELFEDMIASKCFDKKRCSVM